jgi:serine/threonine protein kinase
MDCPHCGAALVLSDDPTQRLCACSGCGQEVDLADVMSGTGDMTGVAAEAHLAGGDPLLGRTLAGGRYRIDGLLGEGGMGRVYLGTQLNLARRVAIKILSEELTGDGHFARRFQREAGVLASLDQNHIVTVHDLGVEDDLHYIVMAYVSGPEGEPLTLRDVMDAGPMEEDLALRVVSQICSALRYAHDRGVVHRDIKPANILLDEDGNAKLADFGIARIAGPGVPEMTMTTPGTVMGTLKYMAPEQKIDATKADARSDLYSLGAVFYEMLTGHAPEGRFDLPSEIRDTLDPRVDRIVDLSLKRAVESRYQNAGEMARDISTVSTEKEYGKLHGDAGASPLPPAPEADHVDEFSPPPLPPHPPRPEKEPRSSSGVMRKLVLVGLLVAVVAVIAAYFEEGGPGRGSWNLAGGVDLSEDVVDIRDELIETLEGGDSVDLEFMIDVRDALGRQEAPDARGPVMDLLQSLREGDGAYVASQIPDVLMTAITDGSNLTRQELGRRMANMRHSNTIQILNTQAVGPGWALVHYRYADKMNHTVFETVAVAIHEQGRWKVVP